MALSTAQLTVANDRHRFRVLITGRRFGKTTLAVRELCRYASQPASTVWYVAPSYRMAKGIVWRKLKHKLQDLRWTEKVNESELTIYLKNGSEISLKGAENADSLRGRAIDFLVMDEFADIDPEAFYEVLRPTLADTQGHALFTGTPKGIGNWSYELFQMSQEDPEHWASYQFTTLQGGFVSETEIAEARGLLDARTFQQEFEATFTTAGNRVWYAFDRATSVKAWTQPTPDVIYVGMDFNIDPMSAVIFAREGDVVYAIDEIEMYSSNTQEMVAELRSRYGKQRIWVYPDPASRQRKTSAGGATDLSILQNAGFTVKCPTSHNPVRDGINAVNSKLCNSLGVRSFFVDPRCRRLIECLERQNFKSGTTQPDKDSGYDHLTDAARYYFDYVFPVRRDVAVQPPQRWGHAIA
ncbi:phage_term_2, phage terminase, large subunit, PBSX family [uncultured Caudovirales phage]|uniref:Phage_term_2, phage terminase, large subunit, PBSX family n=1 Tax=uncultured Caudovirales phage TaxID=2100421 RepID=A0A6J5LSC3_9CAUD|nr:phage_term_2, phage terminase, large subunit, PBSX family [uncultured Caudovirales phage]